MELGATICSVTNPRCSECPLAADCEARTLGVQEQLPITVPREPLPKRYIVSALIERKQKLLLVRRIPKGLLGGLWELPGGELLASEEHAPGLARLLAANLGIQATIGELCTTQRHAYTHFLSFVSIYRCSISGTPLPEHIWDEVRWVSPDELAGYGLSGVTVKVLRTLGYSIAHI
jgi:A/G-specific adenine glycosylase